MNADLATIVQKVHCCLSSVQEESIELIMEEDVYQIAITAWEVFNALKKAWSLLFYVLMEPFVLKDQ